MRILNLIIFFLLIQCLFISVNSDDVDEDTCNAAGTYEECAALGCQVVLGTHCYSDGKTAQPLCNMNFTSPQYEDCCSMNTDPKLVHFLGCIPSGYICLKSCVEDTQTKAVYSIWEGCAFTNNRFKDATHYSECDKCFNKACPNLGTNNPSWVKWLFGLSVILMVVLFCLCLAFAGLIISFIVQRYKFLKGYISGDDVHLDDEALLPFPNASVDDNIPDENDDHKELESLNSGDDKKNLSSNDKNKSKNIKSKKKVHGVPKNNNNNNNQNPQKLTKEQYIKYLQYQHYLQQRQLWAQQQAYKKRQYILKKRKQREEMLKLKAQQQEGESSSSSSSSPNNNNNNNTGKKFENQQQTSKQNIEKSSDDSLIQQEEEQLPLEIEEKQPFIVNSLPDSSDDNVNKDDSNKDENENEDEDDPNKPLI
eukprot:TRINITY_DN229_c3_g1_i2.p1 TRINITY_DN229_c3_g1~~TRINITY_DN229_c3_g1_i2.p1  ORF type:complete len:422 (+),score=156.94 TRINITY_DN229_c3_g1_i2:250-1515(+)